VSAKDYTYLLGKNGIALTELRPAGTAIIEEGPFDVVSEGTYIKRGEDITVIMVNGSRIVVRKKMKVENEQS
jgi:membrane-bound serine protease (ClpP class)